VQIVTFSSGLTVFEGAETCEPNAHTKRHSAAPVPFDCQLITGRHKGSLACHEPQSNEDEASEEASDPSTRTNNDCGLNRLAEHALEQGRTATGELMRASIWRI
jgi:hypothetical protein